MIFLRNKKAAGSAYSETLVTFDGSQYLDASAGAPAGTRSFTIAFSGTLTNVSTRRFIASWNSTTEGIWARYTASASGARGRILTSGLGIDTISEPAATGDRYSFILSSWADGANLNMELSIKDVGASWITADATPSSTTDTSFPALISNTMRLFRERAATSGSFIGTCARLMIATSTTGSAILDPASTTIRDKLVNSSDETVDPTLLQAELGSATRLVDLYGPASNYATGNAGGDGTVTWTLNGTF